MSKCKTFIFYEIGNSCRTEFLLKAGKFAPTEDAVVIGISEGKNAEAALKNLKKECPWIKDYKLHRLVAREVGQANYL